MDCVRKIIIEEGPLAFFKGLETTLWRHGVWSGGNYCISILVYFGSIGNIKSFAPMQKFTTDPVTGKTNDLLMNILAGTIGGTLGTFFNTPFDVVKTRVQNNVYKGNAIGGCIHVAKTEGIKALWKGI